MFPAVLSLILIGLELLAFRGIAPGKLRAAALVLFTVCVTGAYYSGFYGLDYASKLPPSAIVAHQGYGRFVLLMCCPLVVLGVLSALLPVPSPWLKRGYWGVLGGVAAATLYTSYLGGEIVFRHGGGVLGLGY